MSVAFLLGTLYIKRRFKDRKFNKYYNSYIIASSVYVTYFVFKIPVGSLVQAILLNYDFMVVMTVRMLAGFLTSFVHIIIILIALDVSLRFQEKGALLEEPFAFIKRIKARNKKELTNN